MREGGSSKHKTSCKEKLDTHSRGENIFLKVWFHSQRREEEMSNIRRLEINVFIHWCRDKFLFKKSIYSLMGVGIKSCSIVQCHFLRGFFSPSSSDCLIVCFIGVTFCCYSNLNIIPVLLWAGNEHLNMQYWAVSAGCLGVLVFIYQMRQQTPKNACSFYPWNFKVSRYSALYIAAYMLMSYLSFMRKSYSG